MTLDALNRLPADEARTILTRCCGCREWVEQMVASRPFVNPSQLLSKALTLWMGLTPGEWREAFEHHPRIGDLESLKARFASIADLAANEQGAVAEASQETLEALAEGNRAYEERFGYIFIIFASGRSADDMLKTLRQRLNNDPEAELRQAALEQWKIMRLRLDGVLAK